MQTADNKESRSHSDQPARAQRRSVVSYWLIHDLNRSTDRPDAMPERSEAYGIPGNQALSLEQRPGCTHSLCLPFHASGHEEVARILARAELPHLLTLLAFTPVTNGQSHSAVAAIQSSGVAPCLAS